MFGGIEKNHILTDSFKILTVGEKVLKWVDLETKGKSPSARMLHTMTFMEKMNIIIIYGGKICQKNVFFIWYAYFESRQFAMSGSERVRESSGQR